MQLCLPLTCQTYQLQATDDCFSASVNANVTEITQYNTWINSGCDKLHEASVTLGTVLCTTPIGGTNIPGTATNTSGFPGANNTGFGTILMPPPAGSTVAPNTTTRCGGWYKAVTGDSCGSITNNNDITLNLFTIANPSVKPFNCTLSLQIGDTYCVAPLPPPDGTLSTPWQSNGCWANNDPSSSVLIEESFTDNSTMTVEECAAYCIQTDYAFFGIEQSTTCLCGSSVAVNSAQLAATACNTPCLGNKKEMCGGPNGGTSLFGPQGVSLVYDYVYSGCYSDSATERTLAGGKNYTSSTTNTVEACATFCLPQYAYFGLDGGNSCWCSSTMKGPRLLFDHIITRALVVRFFFTRCN